MKDKMDFFPSLLATAIYLTLTICVIAMGFKFVAWMLF